MTSFDRVLKIEFVLVGDKPNNKVKFNYRSSKNERRLMQFD